MNNNCSLVMCFIKIEKKISHINSEEIISQKCRKPEVLKPKKSRCYVFSALRFFFTASSPIFHRPA